MFGKKRLSGERSGKITRADSIFNNTIDEIGFGEEFKKRLLLSKWKDIVGEKGAEYCKIISLKNHKLFLTTNDSTWSDQFKFLEDSIIAKMNSIVGSDLVHKVIFIKNPRNKVLPYVETEELEPDDTTYYDFTPEMDKVELTIDEQQHINENCNKITDENLRETFKRAYIAKLKREKIKIKKGFHQCPVCHSLTEPAYALCPECRRQEKDRRQKKIREIIMDEPWIQYAEMNERVPCTPETFIHQWAYLVQNLLPEVDIEDPENSFTKMFVAIYKHCEPDRVANDKRFIENSLKELRNDFGERYYEMLRRRKAEEKKLN